MIEIAVNDVLEELRDENSRLSDELILANARLALLDKYRLCLQDFSRNCECDRNRDLKSKLNELETQFALHCRQTQANISQNLIEIGCDNKIDGTNEKVIGNVVLKATKNDGQKFVYTQRPIRKVVITSGQNKAPNSGTISATSNGANNAVIANAVNSGQNIVYRFVTDNTLVKSKETNNLGQAIKTIDNNIKLINLQNRQLTVANNKSKNMNNLLSKYVIVANSNKNQKNTEESEQNMRTSSNENPNVRNNSPINYVITTNNEAKPIKRRFAAVNKTTEVRKKLVRHKNTGEMLNCQYPNCKFKNVKRSILSKHMRNVHTTERRFKCYLCESRFKVRQTLNNHIKTIHGDSKFKCDWDGCTFETVYACTLIAHKKRHNGEHNMPFKCDVEHCERAFLTEPKLKEHKIRKHCSIRAFKCDFADCEATFKTSADVRMHKVNTHIGEKRMICYWPGCDYRCRTKNTLDKHFLTHQEIKKYVCDWPQCGKRLSTSLSLQNHIRQHRNERPFKCLWPECTKSYVSNSKLIRHYKTSHSYEKNSYNAE